MQKRDARCVRSKKGTKEGKKKRDEGRVQDQSGHRRWRGEHMGAAAAAAGKRERGPTVQERRLREAAAELEAEAARKAARCSGRPTSKVATEPTVKVLR